MPKIKVMITTYFGSEVLENFVIEGDAKKSHPLDIVMAQEVKEYLSLRFEIPEDAEDA